jgi:hypothetical protein
MDSAPRERRTHPVRRAFVLVSLVVLVLTAFAGGAAARPSETPNGWVGACNMNSSWPTLSPGQAVGIQGTVDFDGDGGGMENAMTVDNLNGNDGMFNATVVSGGQVC